MNLINKNRGELIDIARGFVTSDNYIIRREDIPEMVDAMINPQKGPEKLPFNRENYEKEGVVCKTIEGYLARVVCWDMVTKSGNYVIIYSVDNGVDEEAMFEYDPDGDPLILTLPEPTGEEIAELAQSWLSALAEDVLIYLYNKHFGFVPTKVTEADAIAIWCGEGCQEYANSGDKTSESVASTESAPMGSEQNRANKWWYDLPRLDYEDQAINQETLAAKFFSCPVDTLTADNVLFIWKEVTHNICEKCKGVGRIPSRFEGTALCHRCGGDGYHKKIRP